MRVDEIDAGYHTRDRNLTVAIEIAEAVVCRRRRRNERGRNDEAPASHHLSPE
jgi:hypothetical protein